MTDSITQITAQFMAALDRFDIPKKLKQGESLAISRLAGSSKSLFLNILASIRPVLAVFPDEETAEWIAEECMTLLGEEIVSFFPRSDRSGSAFVGLHARQSGRRMEVLRDLLSGQLKLVITGAHGLTENLPTAESMRVRSIQLLKNAEHPLNTLIEKLTGFGYIREIMVERPGEFSVRGGILDIFPLTGEAPHRIEFWGDTIHSIRTFEIATQRSTGCSESLHLVSALPENADASQSLPDYFQTPPLIFIEDPDLVFAVTERETAEQGSLALSEKIQLRLKILQTVSHYQINAPESCFRLGIRAVNRLGHSPNDIRKRIAALAESEHLLLLADSASRKARLEEFLEMDEKPIPNLSVQPGPLRDGFTLTDQKYTVLTQASLFGRTFRRRPKKRFEKFSNPVRELSSLNKGDYVVHIDHGIGIYFGLQKITVRNQERECLAIRYQEDDMLYVPVDKMERVQKYCGKEGAKPEIHKLGSRKWETLKKRTKQEVGRIAEDLVKLYSSRRLVSGHAFSPDTIWQRELEASFPFEETPDQERAILEIKKDMESPTPMDRLLCGDVGYGKTEVAVRAAFKAVNDNKQAALLVPTTVLAQQHFETFRERLSAFPVTVEMLSRFRSKRTQEEILRKCKEGKVDILIGTHRLLSRDVAFKDLGLLIIDEEQRFGVKHKETLKALRQNVDVLSLSATPIPRTLNFALVGIRDMSTIHTPPVDRMPIHTEVLPFNEAVIVEAIAHELARQGQIFFVHNRIQSIYAVSEMIRKLVPGLRVAVAHGRMKTHDLEEVMHNFIHKKFDCLVATMIVGSGLDMPNVNTLLVNRADRLGLSQLYQLRGRVGRSDQKATAYLFTPPLGLLSQDALKRLQTIEEFTELGAGFQIAIRDLEIRGAGNLLGYRQSGNIDAVGFELYTRLVAEAVEEIKAADSPDKTPHALETTPAQCVADIDADAYLPAHFVSDESTRMDLYRRLSSCRSTHEIDTIAEELTDRFGPVPESAGTLLDLMRLQIHGSRRAFKQIRIEDSSMRCFFHETFQEQFSSSENMGGYLRALAETSALPVRFISKHGLGMCVTLPETGALDAAKKWLQSLG